MKIEIDLPDWVENKNIYIFANFELVAKKITTQSWKIKIKRCVHCGKCCKDFHDRKGLLPTTKEDGCLNLEKRIDGTWWCKSNIPIACLISNINQDYCNVEWKKVKAT